MSTALQDYGARVDAREGLAILGRLAWYTVVELNAKHRDVVAALANAGILQGLPPEPKDVDVFRRVCSSAEKKKIPIAETQTYVNYRMAEFRDKDQIVKRIEAQLVDNKNKILSHEELVDVRFERATGQTSQRALNKRSTLYYEAERIANTVETEYNTKRGCLNAYAIREWIRHFIMGLGATPVRPGGGVYFVKNEHSAALDGLEQFAAAMRVATGSTESVTVHSLPLLDDEKQREMVKEAFEAETAGAIDKLVDEIQALKEAAKAKGEKVPQVEYQAKLEEYSELLAKTKDYSALLEGQLDITNGRLSIFERSIMDLSTEVNWG